MTLCLRRITISRIGRGNVGSPRAAGLHLYMNVVPRLAVGGPLTVVVVDE